MRLNKHGFELEKILKNISQLKIKKPRENDLD